MECAIVSQTTYVDFIYCAPLKYASKKEIWRNCCESTPYGVNKAVGEDKNLEPELKQQSNENEEDNRRSEKKW